MSQTQDVYILVEDNEVSHILGVFSTFESAKNALLNITGWDDMQRYVEGPLPNFPRPTWTCKNNFMFAYIYQTPLITGENLDV